MEKNNKNENLVVKTNQRITGLWFEPFFEKLVAYKENHGNFYNVAQDKEIGEVVRDIRGSYKGKKGCRKLTPKMIERLETIGFPWAGDKRPRKIWFGPFFEKLVAYKEKNGNFVGITQDKEIGQTVRNIRSTYKGRGTYSLTPEMIEKLESIGFPWEAEIKDVHDKWFPQFLEKLVAYKEKNGDFYRITKDKEIGSTVHNLRRAYWGGTRGYKITPEIVEQLDAIGFPWEYDPKDKQKNWFDIFYAKLIEYKEKKGTFKGVIQDKEIGSTAGTVRKLYKDKEFRRLTPEMIEKLEEIGFPWEAEYGEWFEPFFQKLVEYKKAHNGFDGATQDKEIGLKVSSVRKSYNGKGKYRLTQEMIDRLNSIGFPWSAKPNKAKEDELTI